MALKTYKVESTSVKTTIFAKKLQKLPQTFVCLKLHQFAQLLHLTKACLKQNILRFGSAIPYQNLGCKNPFSFFRNQDFGKEF